MGKNYYKIISITPKGITPILKRRFNYNQDAEICCINYKTSESYDNNELYTGVLAESLETKEMERYITQCKKNNKQPAISKLFQKGFAFNGNKKNFLGYTNALIELKFSSKYKKRYIYYENGFYFNGVKYVRYKRSASSARNGKCLFIMEELYIKHMEKWSNCGIDPLTIDDLTSWEAYKGLTLSAIESTITLPYDSILIIKDKISCFKDYVATPFSDSCTKYVDIQNTIWDGEGLLDNSVFMNSDNEDYSSSKCSMLFLRGRFFKTCGFRTNLQLWFKDNHIDSINQINGFTLAKQPKDIKLVITESSLKYHKFINISNEEDCSDSLLKTWLTQWITGQGININTKYKKKSSLITFGVVKTNHPTKYYNGKLVQTNYQLLNTLPIHYSDVQELLKPSFEYIYLSKNSPTFFREFINPESNKPEYDKEDSHSTCTSEFVNDNDPSYTEIDNTNGYRQFFINELLQLTNAFSGTKMYEDFRKKVFSNFRNKIRNGQILVEGTFATLFGNPAEFLYATLKVNKNHQLGQPLQYLQNNILVTTPVLCGNEIFCKHFDDNISLTCARSPHVTMGNLFVAKNRHIDFYTRYFILSEEIVCVNAIKYNLQHKLNGADYDSDAMLITNNPIIVTAAQKIDGIFPSPYNHLTPQKRKLVPTRPLSSQLCDIDSLISDDQTGQIINLSQEINSYIWDSCTNLNPEQAKVFLKDDIEGKYNEVCQLAILSNIALDRAKRNYDINISETLNSLRQSEILYRTTLKGNIFIKERPLFLQKLLGLNPSDYTSEIVNLYRFITKSEKELKIFRSKSEPVTHMTEIFGKNIAVHKYAISCLDEENADPYILYSVAVNQSLNCTMSYIFNILSDKEYERTINIKIKNYLQTQNATLNSSSVKLTDLIEIPKTYKPALKYAEEVKEKVKFSYNEQRKIANHKHLGEKEKHILRSEIIDKCLSDVNDLLQKYHSHIEYLIYILLKDIDEKNLLTQEDKNNKLVAYPSLLFSCICNHTRDNKYIFYDMVNKKAIHSHNKPTEKIVEDENGNINLFTIPHSIKKI